MKKQLIILLSALLCCSCAEGVPDDVAAGQIPVAIDLPPAVEAEQPQEEDAAALAEFALDLLRVDGVSEGNTLVSPVSIVSALGMTAVGAQGKTLAQMEDVMGFDLPRLRAIIPALSASNESFGLANAIWYRDSGLNVNREFAEICQTEFSAPMTATPMDESTRADVNRFVDEATRGMLPDLLAPGSVTPDIAMLLVNALAFEADWQVAYDELRSYDGAFAGIDGQARYLFSTEEIYLEGKHATGFIKPYAGGRYAFAAILPDQKLSLDEYIAGLDGEALVKMLNSARAEEVYATLPKFAYDDEFELAETLQALGMVDAFSSEKADLRGIGTDVGGNLFISGVLHKTHIAVSETGTEAAAATVVTVAAESDDPNRVEPKAVYLNRPFLYVILDTATDMPVFIGTVREPTV